MAEDKNLREAGLKVTLPRIRILEIFEESDTKHLSAAEVYKKLVEAGDEVGHSVYELTPNDHHDHMVCLKTGKVIEFTNEIIEEQQEKLASERGYKIVDHRLVLYVEPLNNEE